MVISVTFFRATLIGKDTFSTFKLSDFQKEEEDGGVG